MAEINAQRISDFIADFESVHNPQDWISRGIRAWPLIRNELYIRLSQQTFGPPSAGGRPGSMSAQLWQPPLRNFIGGSRPAVGDIWLVNDGASYQTLGGHEIDRFCTPLLEACRLDGRQALIVDTRRPGPGGLKGRLWLAGDRVLRGKIRGVLASRLRPDRSIAPWLAVLSNDLRQHGLPDVSTALAGTDAKLTAVTAMAADFAAVMARARPKAVFIVSYYGVVGYALSLAAHRLGIPSIDIQHGVTGPLHCGYSRWTAPPAGGYELMPRAFWAWSERDAGIVNDSFPSGQHKAFALGHPFVDAWRGGLLKGVEGSRNEIEALRAAHHDRRHGLVTLQPGLTNEPNLAMLAGIMARAPDVQWWLRLHPSALGDRDRVAAYLKGAGHHAFDLDDASRLPLYGLLEAADVHMTHSSSTVLEAALFGVPSVIWSDYGAAYFVDQIDRGEAVAALSTEAAATVLADLAARPAASPLGDGAALIYGLKTLLDRPL